MDVEKLKEDWVGLEFDVVEFEMSGEEMVAWAETCGETARRFTDPEDPDFQAPATFTSKFLGRRAFPEGFPQIGRGPGFDAGKSVEIHAPVRPGDVLTARSHIADIYPKTGRSGPMLFIVHRMVFENQDGDRVSVVDWRRVLQPEDDLS